ncbi:33922979-5fb2-4353-aea3-91d2f6de76cc-CDS [Sclerotinia trifoliorum]|uniref:33922979-5fb2-4353-aea3-91d2f6de76cc-CDS n=1 Tax=Sclerotinia trifoliorum TaxID=28548 RepID=A0A8H2VLH4_9HELO|nr:33922979-5fb2-4353-aea3-91d2f6de76cc-CDS [Sclerotinia trifoliorum]
MSNLSSSTCSPNISNFPSPTTTTTTTTTTIKTITIITTTTKTTTTAPLKAAYATLITTPSYIPGVLLLAHTLKKQGSQYPLILMYTGLPENYIEHLTREAKLSNIILHETTLLNLSPNAGVAARFADTWTKLQVFSLYDCGYERICFLDADMLILGPMDELLLNTALRKPGIEGEAGKLLAANHVCVCNLDQDSWAPTDWCRENCAYTTTSNHPPQQTTQHVPPTGTGLRTHTLLNSGLFIFTPSEETWNDMWNFIHTHGTTLSSYQFADQDFLTEWWRDRWVSVGWKWNALKTWRHWHPEMWRDEDVRALHYIVDKPWRARVPASGIAGYKGNDGVTHGWWWEAYGEWEEERREAGEMGILELVSGLVG